MVGESEKLMPHQNRLLHRAFSVFIFNQDGKLLIQQRAAHKYHSGGLWANTCCGHPSPHSNVQLEAELRLQEEVGIHASLHYVGYMIYNESVSDSLYEYEYDYIYVGISDDIPKLNEAEIMDYKYVDIVHIAKLAADQPEQYAIWFRLLLSSCCMELLYVRNALLNNY